MELLVFLGFWSVVALIAGIWATIQIHKENKKEKNRESD